LIKIIYKKRERDREQPKSLQKNTQLTIRYAKINPNMQSKIFL